MSGDRCPTCGNVRGPKGDPLDSDVMFLEGGQVAYRLLFGGWRVIPEGVVEEIRKEEPFDPGSPSAVSSESSDQEPK